MKTDHRGHTITTTDARAGDPQPHHRHATLTPPPHTKPTFKMEPIPMPPRFAPPPAPAPAPTAPATPAVAPAAVDPAAWVAIAPLEPAIAPAAAAAEFDWDLLALLLAIRPTRPAAPAAATDLDTPPAGRAVALAANWGAPLLRMPVARLVAAEVVPMKRREQLEAIVSSVVRPSVCARVWVGVRRRVTG